MFNLAFAPDGLSMLVAGLSEEIQSELRMLRVVDREIVWTKKSNSSSMTFSADGATVLVGTTVLRAADGEELLNVRLQYGIRAVSADARLVLGMKGRTSTVALLRVPEGEPVWERQFEIGIGAFPAVFAPDGKTVVFGVRDGETHSVETASGRIVRTLGYSATAVAFSSDSRLLALALPGGVLEVWDTETGSLLVRQPGAPGHRDPVVHVAMTSNGRLIGSMGFGQLDKAVRVWRATDGALLHQSPFQPGRDLEPDGFTFSPDSSLMARTGEGDGFVHIVRAEQGTMVRSISLRDGLNDRSDAKSLAFAPDGATLAVASDGLENSEGLVARVFRIEDGRELMGFRHQSEGVTIAMSYSPGGTGFASIRRVFVDGGRLVLSLHRATDRSLLWTSDIRARVYGGMPQAAPVFSPDGRWIATADHTVGVRIYAATGGDLLTDLDAPRAAGVAFSPDGTLLLVATDTGLRTFATKTWSLLRQVPGAFKSVAFSPDGRTVLVGGVDGTVRLVCNLTDGPL